MIRLSSGIAVFLLALSCWAFTASVARPDEPKQRDNPAEKDLSAQDLNLRLAKARLKLAKLELERAIKANEKAAIYTTTTLELLRTNVDIAQARLDAVGQPEKLSMHAAHLREVEGAAKIADLRLKQAEQLHEEVPSSFSESRVESMRLRAEIARLELQRARNPAVVSSPLEHLQWQMDQLRQELLDLNLRVEELSNPR
jgi:hypothetical protein